MSKKAIAYSAALSLEAMPGGQPDVSGEVLAMYFRPSSQQGITFKNVFQHFAADSAPLLRATVLSVIHQSINRSEDGYPHMGDTRQMIDPAHYQRLRTIISPNLYYKSFNLREKQKQILANELIWKWTEATGKYIGCQFWSVEAQDLFNAELRNRHGKVSTFDRAWSLAEELCKTRIYRPKTLNHEHVLPIANLCQMLQEPLHYPEFTSTKAKLQTFFERAVVGCVMLKREHDEIHSRPANWDNSWLRYKGSSIKLVPNPNWPAAHHQMIKEANLL